jgi:regulator of RNase E activity RraA
MAKLDIGPYPELLSDEIIQRAAQFDAANVCDGMVGLGIPREGCMDGNILGADRKWKIVGTAITVETSEGDNLPIHVALYNSKPGYVMVIDGKGDKNYPYFGDIMMNIGKAVGFKGMIVDGFTRDREASIELGFPIFSRGFMPRGPAKKNPGSINKPIFCGGVRVCPGDLVIADYDGVCVVPRARIDEALTGAANKIAKESKRRATIKAFNEKKAAGGKWDPMELAPQWVLDMLAEVK